jgi:uncharacterized protein (TIGR03086 family)
MDPIDALDQAWTAHAKLIAGLDTQQLTASTDCTEWNVRGLLNHTLGEAQMMTMVNRGEQAGNDHGDLVGDGTDLPEMWARFADDNVSSWRESGLEGERAYFYGTFPASAALLINLGEVLVHGWDLAQATGQDTTLDPDHAALVYDLYGSFPLDGMRAGGTLGPEVVVSGDAPLSDRLLGLLGRHPQ